MSAAALINCYGLYGQNRSEIELEGLTAYFKKIALILQPRIDSGEISVIALNGGFTSVNNNSEAESSKPVLLEYLKIPDSTIVITQNVSQNTFENLALGYLAIREWNPDNLIVFCDSSRITKVKVEAAGLFGDLIYTEVIAVDRSDNHPNSNYQKQSEEILPSEIFGQEFRLWSKLIQSYLVRLRPKVYTG